MVYHLHTIRIGIFESSDHAEELYKKYFTVFCSLCDEFTDFSDAQISVFEEIKLKIMPLMKKSIDIMESYRMHIGNCLTHNYKCLSLPKEMRTRKYKLWNGISYTKKALNKLSELLQVIKNIFINFLEKVRILDVL